MQTCFSPRPILVLALVFLLVGCRSAGSEPARESPMKLTSPAFKEGESIPKQYTCDGENISPPLAWSGVPEGAESVAILVEDPDAPRGNWVHWVLFNLSVDRNRLDENERAGLQGANDFHDIGYGGPCPPRGKPHRYFFKVYALDTQLNIRPGASKAILEKAMEGHILAQGQLMGTYSR